MVFRGTTPKLDFTIRDAGMVAADTALAMGTKDFLVAQNSITADIFK